MGVVPLVVSVVVSVVVSRGVVSRGVVVPVPACVVVAVAVITLVARVVVAVVVPRVAVPVVRRLVRTMVPPVVWVPVARVLPGMPGSGPDHGDDEVLADVDDRMRSQVVDRQKRGGPGVEADGELGGRVAAPDRVAHHPAAGRDRGVVSAVVAGVVVTSVIRLGLASSQLSVRCTL